MRSFLVVLGLWAPPSQAAAPRAAGPAVGAVRVAAFPAGAAFGALGGTPAFPPAAAAPPALAVRSGPTVAPSLPALAPATDAVVPAPASAPAAVVPARASAHAPTMLDSAGPTGTTPLPAVAADTAARPPLRASARRAGADLFSSAIDATSAARSFDGRRPAMEEDVLVADARPPRFPRAAATLAAAQTAAFAATVGDAARIDRLLFRIDDARQAWDALSLSGLGQALLQSVTSGFIHHDMGHFLGNLTGFLLLAPLLESMAGAPVLLAYFFGGMLAGDAATVLAHAHGYALGASAGVAALLGAFAADVPVLLWRGAPADASWRETARTIALFLLGLFSLLVGTLEIQHFLAVGPVENGVGVGAHAAGWAFGFLMAAAAAATGAYRRQRRRGV